MLSLFSFACICVFRADFLVLNNYLGACPWGRTGLPPSALTHLPRAVFLGVVPHETHSFFKKLFFSTFLDLGCSHVLLISLIKTTFEARVVPVSTILSERLKGT